MKVRIKKLVESAVMPKRGTEFSAGFDLTATSKSIDWKKRNAIYGTGLAFEIPVGYVGLLFPRSSVCEQALLLSNCVGMIDSDYRGEVKMKFRITDDKGKRYNIGDRIGQIIIIKPEDIEYEFAEELSKTERCEGGYGSTGR